MNCFFSMEHRALVFTELSGGKKSSRWVVKTKQNHNNKDALHNLVRSTANRNSCGWFSWLCTDVLFSSYRLHEPNIHSQKWHKQEKNPRRRGFLLDFVFSLTVALFKCCFTVSQIEVRWDRKNKVGVNFSKRTRTSLETFEFKADGFSVMACAAHTIIDSAVQRPQKTLNCTIVSDPFPLLCVFKPLTRSCSAFANGNEC